MTIDVSEFGAWREAVCDECETLHLVTGPPSGPARCRDCWLDTFGAVPNRPPAAHRTDDVPLFDPAPYAKRKERA